MLKSANYMSKIADFHQIFTILRAFTTREYTSH